MARPAGQVGISDETGCIGRWRHTSHVNVVVVVMVVVVVVVVVVVDCGLLFQLSSAFACQSSSLFICCQNAGVERWYRQWERQIGFGDQSKQKEIGVVSWVVDLCCCRRVYAHRHCQRRYHRLRRQEADALPGPKAP